MGQSDLAGTVTVETDRPRHKVVADLQSQRLDYRDLGGSSRIAARQAGGVAAGTEGRSGW